MILLLPTQNNNRAKSCCIPGPTRTEPFIGSDTAQFVHSVAAGPLRRIGLGINQPLSRSASPTCLSVRVATTRYGDDRPTGGESTATGDGPALSFLPAPDLLHLYRFLVRSFPLP
jgi:hypothetical protein